MIVGITMQRDIFLKYGGAIAGIVLIFAAVIGFLVCLDIDLPKLNVKKGYEAISWLLISVSLFASTYIEKKKVGAAPEPYMHPILKLLFKIGPIIILVGLVLGLLKETTILQSESWKSILEISSFVDGLIPLFFVVLVGGGWNMLSKHGFQEIGMALGLLRGTIDIQVSKLDYVSQEKIKGKLILSLKEPQEAKELKVRVMADMLISQGRHSYKRMGVNLCVSESVIKGEGAYTNSEYDFELTFPNPVSVASRITGLPEASFSAESAQKGPWLMQIAVGATRDLTLRHLVWEIEGVLVLKDSSTIKKRISIHFAEFPHFR